MKEYIVVLRNNQTNHWYSVDAPSKRVARWCAVNMFQNEYCAPALKPSDFKAYSKKWTARKDIKEMKR